MLRTGIAGALAAIADVAALILLVESVRAPVGVAAFFAAGVGAIAGFVLSKYWAFRDFSHVDPRQIMVYALVALFNATLVAMSVHALAEGVGIAYLYAKAISAVLVFVCWSYPAQSRLVFRRA